MKRAINGLLGALLLSGTLLATVAAPESASADPFQRRRVETRRTRDWDRDGIRNRRDRDDDNDGIRDRWDRNDRNRRYRSSGSNRYSNGRYYNGRWYPGNSYYGQSRGPNGDLDGDGIINRRDRDRDGDGRRNDNDDHPSDRRRR